MIHQQEKLELLTQKKEIANDLIENKLFSRQWIYDNIFEFFSEWRNVLRAMFATFSVRNVLTLQHAPEINHPGLQSYRLKLDEFNLRVKKA